ncbi:MAG: NADP-dependent isocitrate dehydrogenase [Candidatus Marinimicrobia bacterium]|nr:NADP-dependent isocitrate dehydrogenase [Candidatus Neomarinimicrobiota bacterium]
MKKLQIPFIQGDGVGQEITQVTLNLVQEVVHKYYSDQVEIEWIELLAGEKAFRETGEYLPEKTLATLKNHPVAIKGPLTTPVGEGFRSLNVQLRQELDLYTCYRPVRYFCGVPSPVKFPEQVDLHIFRENTEDIYAGIEFMQRTEDNEKMKKFLLQELKITGILFPETSSLGVKPISEEGSKRLVRAAIQFALDKKLPSVTLVHKGNIMKFTEGAFCKWGYEVAKEEYSDQTIALSAITGPGDAKGKVIIQDCIADAFLQNLLLKPYQYSVIATTNLNGDYISDMAAAMVGGIGMAPGANINYQTRMALFEATHGTAPDIAGQGKANPGSLILSAAMMLDYLNLPLAAEALRDALEKVISHRKVTSDLHAFIPYGELLTTQKFGEEIAYYL